MNLKCYQEHLCELKSESASLTSFVNQICGKCKEVEDKNKDLKKSVALHIEEKIVMKDLQCYDWAEELPELKTSAPKKCPVYHLAGYIVKDLPKLLTAVTVLFHYGTTVWKK